MAVTQEVLALVQGLQPAGQTHALVHALTSGNGHSAPIATLELPQVVAEETPAAPAKEAIESLVRPLIESTALAPPAPSPMEKAPVEPAPEPLPPWALSEAMALQAELALDSMAQRDVAEVSAIHGIVASSRQPPKANLLAPASEEVIAPAPPCLQWMRIPRPQLSLARPKELNPADLMSGLQTPPLAGPCVPQALRNLSEQAGQVRGQARKKAGLPAWTVSFLIAITVFLGVGSLLQYWAANREAKAGATTQSSDQSSSLATGEQAGSKLVEVTGLRIASGPNHKPQLEFIVVNHSATQLSGVGLQIAVRSASSSSGVAPLFRVSTTIASLGPYQSREFRAELDPEVHATDVPDWQSLRADVRITP